MDDGQRETVAPNSQPEQLPARERVWLARQSPLGRPRLESHIYDLAVSYERDDATDWG